MIRAKAESTLTPWFAKAGAACSIVPLSRFVSSTIFALKNGGYGCLFALDGVDEESLTDADIENRVRLIEGGLHGLPAEATLYQYVRIRTGFPMAAGEYQSPVTTSFAADRMAFLESNAGFRRVDLHWCLILEPSKKSPLGMKPSQNDEQTARMLRELDKASQLIVGHFAGPLGMRIVEKNEAFQFFSYLFNLEDWSAKRVLRTDDALDQQIVNSAVSWNHDHITAGKKCVQVYSLTDTPAISRPCMLAGLMALNADSVLCTTWQPKTYAEARREIENQEKFVTFFSAGILQRVMAGKNTESLEKGAGAKAALQNVDDLGMAVRDLDKHTQGKFSLRLLVAAEDVEQLHAISPSVHRVFVEAQCPVMEETLGNLSGYYAMFPGNRKFDVFQLWLGEDHHARLASIFAPAIGHRHSEDLDAEYLNVFETRSGTPFFQDAYVNGVRVQLIVGPTGSGKSVHANQMLALEQKYNGFTYIFDIGGSYESLVELYGGRVDRIGLDGPRVNPFALEPTEKNIQFLYSFIKLLLVNGGASILPEEEDAIVESVRGMYIMEPWDADGPCKLRRLRELYLPLRLQRYLAKWVKDGIYAALFDNVKDSLALSRVQCFDFQGLDTKQHSDLIEPLMVWLLRRINDVVYDPANLGVPKHVLIEELFSNMKNKQLLDAALSSIKTVRKNLGGVTLIAQSANDLGDNADSIVNSCSSFLLLPDATFNREHYAQLFKMDAQQLALFESLREREGLYMRRDGLTKVVILNLDPRSYAAFTTKPKDRSRRAALVARYGLRDGLDRFAKGEVA